MSRGMLRLRLPAGAVVAIATVACGTEVADAELILSAICAMNVPRPIITAAKIIMLRIIPLPSRTLDFTTRRARLRAMPRQGRRHFDEKDERTVNTASRPARLRAPGRQRSCRIVRPGMARIAAAQVRTHGRVAAAPEAGKIARH